MSFDIKGSQQVGGVDTAAAKSAPWPSFVMRFSILANTLACDQLDIAITFHTR